MASPSAQSVLLARHDYAIVDRAAVTAEPWHAALPLHPIVPGTLQADADKMPALLPLNQLTEGQVSRLCDNLLAAGQGQQDHVLSCLLAVPAVTELKRLQRHLADRLVLHAPQGAVLLRYYDSRVFGHLGRVLGPTLIRALFGPVAVWSYRFQHEWVAATVPDVADIRQYWGVSAAQRQRLDRIGLVNVTLAQWQARLARPWSSWAEYDNAAGQVDQALDLGGQSHQLSDEADLTAFALHALTYGAHHHLHPHIQRVLHDSQRGTASYADATDLFDERQWADIAAGHRPPTLPRQP